MTDFFRKAVCGDIERNEVRKVIVRNLIREIVLYEDKVVITFNFIDTPIAKKRPPDDIDEIEEKVRQAEKPANKNTKGENKNTGFPPNPDRKLLGFLFESVLPRVRSSFRANSFASLLRHKCLRIPPPPPQENCTHPNDKKFRCVYFFSHEYFGIIINR